LKFVYRMPFWTAPPTSEFATQDAIMELSALAEAAGFSAVAFTEHPIPADSWRRSGGHDALDPFVALSFAAAATRTLRLLTYLVVLPYRNPFLLAKSVASLDAVSGGRLTLGLGAGYQKSEFFALGVDFEERNTLFDEAVEVMKLAWTGEPVTYQGRRFSARGVAAQPVPAQTPHPPLWLGGNSKLTIRRVAEHGQGWMALPTAPGRGAVLRSPELNGLKDLEAKIAELHAYAAQIGRREPIDIHQSLNDGHAEGTLADMLAQVRDLSGLGVAWGGWQAAAKTVAEAKDEMKRFADAVIAKA
jgi:probable F420-dependent oxidoreductase